jgi:phosphate-selective porin OprO/OprP
MRLSLLAIATLLASGICAAQGPSTSANTPAQVVSIPFFSPAHIDRLPEPSAVPDLFAQRPVAPSPVTPAAASMPILSNAPTNQTSPESPPAGQPSPFRFAKDPTSNLPEPDWADDVEDLRSTLEELKKSHEKLLKGDTGKPSIQWTTELQLDDYNSAQSALNRSVVGAIPDGMAFRRARVGLLGDYSIASYRLEVDFAQSGRPTFLDVWASINDLPILGQVKIGNFFEPFGLERITSNRFTTFMERNLTDQSFTPARSPGVQAMDHWNDGFGTWAVGYFRPHTDNFGDGDSFSGDQAVTSRVTWLPYYDEPSGGRYYTHFGAAFSFRVPSERVGAFAAQPESRLGSAVPNIPFFIDTGSFREASHELYGLEFAHTYGPWHILTETTLAPVQCLDRPNAFLSGSYCETGYFLTGEHRPYRLESATFDRVHPLSDFFRVRTERGVRMGPGAWQLAFRVSYVNMTDGGLNGGRLTDTTLGLNWYLNRYMRMTSNWVHPMLVRPGTTFSTADLFAVRMQFEF